MRTEALLHLNPLHVRHVVLTTRLSPLECAERVKADLAPWWSFLVSDRQLSGRVSEERLAVRRFHGTRQRLPSEARGSFVPGGDGTRLELSIGWRRIDVVGVAIALPGALVAVAIAEAGQPAQPWLLGLVLLLVLAAVVINRLVTVGDDEFLVQRLVTLLEARESSDPY